MSAVAKKYRVVFSNGNAVEVTGGTFKTGDRGITISGENGSVVFFAPLTEVQHIVNSTAVTSDSD